jgi:hypothetical protein
MEDKVKRPPSVWIAQILLLLFASFFLTGLIPLLFLSLSGPPLILLLVLLFDLAASSLCIASFWGLAARKPYGRWLSVVALVLSLGLIGLVITVGFPIVTFLFGVGSFVFLIYRLAFGSAANAFFAKPTADE